MNIYITYDAHNGRSDIKPALIKAGFFDHWKSNNKTYYLPNTSLWRKDLTTTAKAKQIFDSTIANLNSGRKSNDKITIGRFIVVEWNSFSGIEGEPHT